jgi:hypothetical protein
MAVLFALAAWKINNKLGVFFTAYALLIQIGSVLLGWHYAIDGYSAALLTLSIWYLSGSLYRWITEKVTNSFSTSGLRFLFSTRTSADPTRESQQLGLGAI